MMRYLLLMALLTASGCGGSFWCYSYKNGISGNMCYPDKQTCEWNHDRGEVSPEDLELSRCESYPRAHCFSARRGTKSFDMCYLDAGECKAARERVQDNNAETHSLTQCAPRSASAVDSRSYVVALE